MLFLGAHSNLFLNFSETIVHLKEKATQVDWKGQAALYANLSGMGTGTFFACRAYQASKVLKQVSFDRELYLNGLHLESLGNLEKRFSFKKIAYSIERELFNIKSIINRSRLLAGILFAFYSAVGYLKYHHTKKKA